MKRFGYAGEGIKIAMAKERNLQIQVMVSIVVILFSLIIHVSLNDFIIVLLLIGLVLTIEMVNTAIECVVDLVTEEYHPLAKKAKDIAAGAVLLFSTFSVIIGLIIFVKTIYYS